MTIFCLHTKRTSPFRVRHCTGASFERCLLSKRLDDPSGQRVLMIATEPLLAALISVYRDMIAGSERAGDGGGVNGYKGNINLNLYYPRNGVRITYF